MNDAWNPTRIEALTMVCVQVMSHDSAARIAGRASAHGTTLREAALASGEISEAQFDAWTDPRGMLGLARPAEGMP